MRRMFPALVLLLLLLAIPAGGAGAQSVSEPTPAPATPAPQGQLDVCDVFGLGLEGLMCQGVTGAVEAGTGAVVASGAQAALNAVVQFVAEGAGWLLGQLVGLIDGSTRPDVTSGWFRGAYADMAAIAVLGLLPFLLLAIVQGVVRQDPGQLLRSAFVFVPVAALGTGAAVVVVDMLVTITDGMSNWIGRSMGTDLTDFTTRLGTAVLGVAAPGGISGGVAAGFAALLGAIVVGFATFAIWLELVLRQAAIYVAVLFMPLGFMAQVWPATAHWLRRLVQGLVAVILSKFVIVAVMALAATALATGTSPAPGAATSAAGDVAGAGFGVVVGGGALLSLAALAPYVLLKLIPVFDAGMTSQFEGTFRRPTAAVSPPNRSRSQISHMLHQRLTGGGGGAAAGAGVAGGGGSGLAGATGGKATAGAGAGLGGLAAAGVGAAAAGAKATQAATGSAVRTADQATTGNGQSTASDGKGVKSGGPTASPASVAPGGDRSGSGGGGSTVESGQPAAGPGPATDGASTSGGGTPATNGHRPPTPRTTGADSAPSTLPTARPADQSRPSTPPPDTLPLTGGSGENGSS